MATRKGRLGKGLDSLIADKVGTSNEKTDAKNEVMVNINKVEPNKEQPRKNFDEDALLELSESIKQFGVLHLSSHWMFQLYLQSMNPNLFPIHLFLLPFRYPGRL